MLGLGIWPYPAVLVITKPNTFDEALGLVSAIFVSTKLDSFGEMSGHFPP